jgi:phosphoglycerate dehydrogenase-like enzyme
MKAKMPQGHSISRRNLFNRAAVAAAGAGLAALVPQAADAASVGTADARPTLPLKLLTLPAFDDAVIKQIQQISPQITLLPAGDRFAAELPNADVLYGKVTAEDVAKATSTRWIAVQYVGVDGILTPEFLGRSVLLTNSRGCSANAIAEQAWGLILGLTRGVGLGSYSRKWDDWSKVRQVEMRGLTMGIIGFGAIGREVARRAKVMDMRVLAVDAEPLYGERYRTADELWLVDTHLDEMLRQTDVLVSCVPLTQRTRGMLGAREFALLRPDAYVINVSRGPIVKTDDLLAAIQSGKVAGTGLDVTDPEPLPADHPLWKQPNVLITPHKAGRSQLTVERETKLFLENLRRYVAGLPMLNVVDKQKGY